MMNDAPGHDAAGAAPDWDAIARYLAGESPADEARRVRAWLDANPADRTLVERIGVEGAELPLADVDLEAALDLVHARMRNQMVAFPAARVSRRLWRSAAVGSLAVAAAIIGVMVVRRSPSAAPEGGAKTYATAVGQRDSVRLSDGTRVILGPASRLDVPAEYGAKTRTVELTGDAYFDVRHDAASPFAVRVAHAYIEDIGTRFNVESDPGDTTTVAVLGGSVKLRGTGSGAVGIVLTAGDRGSVADNGPAVRDSGRADAEDVAWASGRLVFHDASLLRVAGELRRWYGVRLVFTDPSLSERRLTASFQGESADQVLRTIGLTLGVYVNLQGDSAIVSTTQGSSATR